MNIILIIVGAAVIALAGSAMGLHADLRISAVVGAGYVLGRISAMVDKSRAEPK